MGAPEWSRILRGDERVSDAIDELFRQSGLLGQPGAVDEQLVLHELSLHYGIEGRLTRLQTEKDSTFRLTGERDGAPGQFLVKVSQPDEPEAVVRCQVDVVEWIERHDPTIPVQTVVPDRDGRPLRALQDPDGRFLGLLRVQAYIAGALLVETTPTAAQLREVGATLGRLDVALSDFSHAGADRVLVWDLSRFSSLRPLIALEPDAHRRSLATAVFDGFDEHVVPALATARTQVIHGDFSPYNVVIEPGAEHGVRGVIDFGDALMAPVIFDPAVLLANHLQAAPLHPWEVARELLAGYRQAFALTDGELRMLVHASLARVVLRALVANRRIANGTGRADYVRQHAQHDWTRIENALGFGRHAAFQYLQHHDPSKERG